jgi:hypothetical protein
MPSSPLLDWVLESSQRWCVVELTWARSLATPLYDFAATYEHEGKCYEGRGTSFDRDLALAKACAEALERWAMHEQGHTSSNGLALHICAEQAQELARRELWERDSFLARHLSRAHAWEPLAAENSSERFLGVLRLLEAQGVECLFSIWQEAGLFGVACSAWGEQASRPFGVVVGLGTGTTAIEAHEKAAFEALRNAMAVLNGETDRVLDASMFGAEVVFGPRTHRALALDLAYARRLRAESALGLAPADLDPASLQSSSQRIEGTPFYLGCARDPAAQELFWGPVNEALIHERIKKGGRVLSALPHPVA